MNFYMPTRIIIENGCVQGCKDSIFEGGKKVLIVTGKSSAKKCGALDDACILLQNACCEYLIYDKIEQNPSIESCIEGGRLAKSFGADLIIGIGGGSPLDAAKAIAVLAANDGISEADFYSLCWKSAPLPVVAIGTTAGTGSEVTQVAVITNSKGLKKSIRDDSIYPVLALGDPKYTKSLSDSFTRSTAADALAHCIESYFNKTANDFSKVFALRGTRLIIDAFRLIESGKEPDADMRHELYLASIYGGLAISVTGTNFPHAMSYFLSENHGVAHGTACAFYLPEFIEHNLVYAKDESDAFFSALGITPDELCGLIKEVAPKVDVKLTDGQKSELSPRWQGNSCLKKCYGDISPEFLQQKINKLF